MYAGIALTSCFIFILSIFAALVTIFWGSNLFAMFVVFILLLEIYHSWCFNTANILGMRKNHYEVTRSIVMFIIFQFFLIFIFSIMHYKVSDLLSFGESVVTAFLGYVGGIPTDSAIFSKENLVIIFQGIISIINIPILIWLFTTYMEWRIENLNEMQEHNRRLHENFKSK